jgi:hypothetical protein
MELQKKADVFILAAIALWMLDRDQDGKRRRMLNAHNMEAMVQEFGGGQPLRQFLRLDYIVKFNF